MFRKALGQRAINLTTRFNLAWGGGDSLGVLPLAAFF